MWTRQIVSGPIARIASSRFSSSIAVNCRLRLLRRAVVAVRVLDVPHLGDERLERLLQRRDAVDRERAHRRPVVGDLARDRLVAARGRRADALVVPRLVCRHPLAAAREVVLARELPRRLDRLGAAGDEEGAVEVARRERGQLARELDRARVRVRPVRVEGQLAHLLERRLADLLAEAVADVDREEAGERVQVALPVRVLEVAAVAADDDRHLVRGVAAHAGEVHPQVVAGGLLQVGGGVVVLMRRFPSGGGSGR